VQGLKRRFHMIASPPQAVVDLSTSPGRGPQEAEALIEKMRGTAHEWQSP
jgi:hypothetical protein